MFKMLIVEDEKWVREGLRDLLDWKKLSIEIAGIAYDGIDGLEKSREIKPDIIITDIKMPGVDGIEMSKRIKSFLPKVKIVILTGYNDFKYAREAISFNAFEYLLKPIEEKEILDVITRVVLECKEEYKKIKQDKELISKIKYTSDIIKEKLLFDLYEGKKEKKDLMKQINNLSLGVEGERFYTIVVSYLPNYNERQADSRGEENIEQGLYTDLIKIFDNTDLVLKINEVNQIVFYIYLPFIGEKIGLNKIKTCHKGLSDKYNQEIVIGIGEKVEEIYDIYLSCRQARQALDYGFFWCKPMVIQYTTVKKKKKDFNSRIGYFLKKANTYKKRIRRSLRSSNERLLFELLEDLFLFIKKNDGIERDFIFNYLFSLINDTFLLIYNILDNEINISENKEDIVEQLSDLISLRQVKAFIFRIYKNIIDCIYQRKSNKDKYIVERVIQIIEKEYMTGLSLRTIAEKVFLSPNYLGKIFKKSTGITFNRYLNDIRMEKAKELLQYPENNVTSVSEQIGIPNTSYFCVLFKKNFGITPGEYQELYIQK